MDDKKKEAEYMKQGEDFIKEVGVPYGADAAFIAGVEFGLKLREEELK